ncbi:S9 family peptidase [Streptomyces fradiae]|uniref:S9 family peptidase n=1 Tax=Streptomyces fradiae TaxID=1906 RepID=UPI002943B3CC|nr:prolyl oligopeptidase family serine peptidase [Streptomyces fradiae]WOI60805.1 prolyl oligopeptidase family serine peptidase [Streptomyces fradiae]
MAAEARHRLSGAGRDDPEGPPVAAPSAVPLAPAEGARGEPVRFTAHGCWYPSADPYGARLAYVCDRGGVPQLWTGPVDGDGAEAHLLDAGPDPVTEVAWSPDGRWIAYTTRPGGGEHSRVLCVRPDGTGRRILAGAEPGTSAYLGCWLHDGTALAVTVASPAGPSGSRTAPGAVPAAAGRLAAPGRAPAGGWRGAGHGAVTDGGQALAGERAGQGEPWAAPPPVGWSERDGHAVLLGGAHRGDVDPAARALAAGAPEGPAAPGALAGAGAGGATSLGRPADGLRADGRRVEGHTVDGYAVGGHVVGGPAASGHPAAVPARGPGHAPPGASSVRAGGGLAAYLVDPDGVAAPALVAVERTAATLRVCDVDRDGRLAVLRRGPRNRREAVVVRLTDLAAAAAVPVADGDPWVAAFSPDGRRLWLRSDADREFAALLAADLAPDGTITRVSVAAERPGADLELLAVGHEGRGAFLAWNDGGVSALEFRPLPSGPGADGTGGDGPGADRTGGEDPAAKGPGVQAPGTKAPAPYAPAAPRRTVPEPAASASAASATPRSTAPRSAASATPVPDAPAAPDPAAPDPAAYADPPVVEGRRDVPLPHEVATRVAPAGPGRAALALSGSRRRPGVWWLPGTGTPLMTPWSSRDEDAVPPGRRPTRPVLHRFTAQDGMPLSGWYYRAPGRAADRPAPCVLHLHGGPEEQERPVLEPLYHELLGRGFDVFAPDVRGSSGHGRSFVDADLGTGRFAAIQDVADCAAHAVLAGPADPSRLAVMGRSYGGYLVMASLVWHPELFRTGVAVCGMSDFRSFFAGTEPWIAESAAHKYGHPERDRELLRSLSPLHRVDALRVPVLAVHGEHDTNVPPGESEQFVRAARERGVAAELLTLRDEGHDFQRADNRRLFRRSAADWLERHLAGGGGGPAPFARREE